MCYEIVASDVRSFSRDIKRSLKTCTIKTIYERLRLCVRLFLCGRRQHRNLAVAFTLLQSVVRLSRFLVAQSFLLTVHLRPFTTVIRGALIIKGSTVIGLRVILIEQPSILDDSVMVTSRLLIVGSAIVPRRAAPR